MTINLFEDRITGPGGYTVGIAQDTYDTRIGDVVQFGSLLVSMPALLFAKTAHIIKDVNASNNDGSGVWLYGGGSRLIGDRANNNNQIGIYVANCPNLMLKNIAQGNPWGDIGGELGCDTSQETVLQP